jgi:hypothetical protein
MSALLPFTSPRGGEVGLQSNPGEGAGRPAVSAQTPHPTPLPVGERVKKKKGA